MDTTGAMTGMATITKDGAAYAQPFRCPEGSIGVEPFEQKGIELEQRSGLAGARQKVELVGTKVVVGNSKYRTGLTVYFEGEVKIHHKTVYEIEGRRFTLIADDLVKLYKW